MGLTYRRGLLRRWGVAHVVVLGVILCFGVPGKRHPRLGEIVDLADPGSDGSGEGGLGGKEPRPMVIKRPGSSKRLANLVFDIRQFLSPYTPVKLKELRKNTLQDFLQAGRVLGMTHLIILSESPAGSFMRIVKSPMGPTFTFKLRDYNLLREVIEKQVSRPNWKPDTNSPAVLVMKGLNKSLAHHQLVSTLFQGLFKNSTLDQMHSRDFKRLALLTRNSSSQQFTLRQYITRQMPPSVRDENNFTSINISHALRATNEKLVRIWEIGPRLDMELIRIDEKVPQKSGSGRLLFYIPPPGPTNNKERGGGGGGPQEQ
ncbi:hypothetical protein AAMO2058_000752500 [Amorphochlora amoebiformis]